MLLDNKETAVVRNRRKNWDGPIAQLAPRMFVGRRLDIQTSALGQKATFAISRALAAKCAMETF